jgi:glutamine amidotransferase-like uncharacterized protein
MKLSACLVCLVASRAAGVGHRDQSLAPLKDRFVDSWEQKNRRGRGASDIKIGFYQGNGTSEPHHNDVFFSTLNTAATKAFNKFTITNLTEAAVGALMPGDYSVVVFPGGSGNGQAAAIGDAGMAAVRNFVSSGGGYIGTCGGAFLGIQHIKFYGNGPNGPSGRGPPTQEPFDRGHGTVNVEFTKDGVADLGLDVSIFGGNKNVTIMYWQGPIVKTVDLPKNVSKLAFFRTEIHSKHTNETTGEMVNTPAITSLDNYGKGRVVLNSPHPELDPKIPDIYTGELLWVLRNRQ